ncbi:MAG TPA: serine/threonine-protein kinase [Candidatus Eisenbacteria bacterium]|nr:serine/threonine-protein kinase [Candidatus Eisenbacteria bacterium]
MARRQKGGDTSWSFAVGDEIVPGFHAWALLGDGRRCESWLAWCTRRWTPVVIKLPRPDCINERTYQALSREAEKISALSHPGIQRLLEARCRERLPYLVFEYVEGPTLADWLDEHGPLTPPNVVRLGLQIASALHYMHCGGVVHCDVKPSNIAVREGRAVLLDFDIARRIGEEGRAKAAGSVHYMSPEQIRGEPAAPSMDIFALGATLYEAATNVILFDFKARPPVSEYPQLTRQRAPLRSLDPEIPEELDRVIRSLLEVEPQRRPPTALAALSRLARALPKSERGLWPAWANKLMRRANSAVMNGDGMGSAPRLCPNELPLARQLETKLM